jgi:hypothetical protein
VAELETAGISRDDVSIVANNADDSYGRSDAARADDVADEAGKGAAAGGVLGGAAGLLAGLGMLAIPGVGPVVAAGWLISTAAGAAVGAAAGAATGGIIGALTGAGISREDAEVYAEGVRRGGTLLTVRASDADAPRVRSLLQRYKPVDILARRQSYRSAGWSGFDEKAAPYTADQIARERATYRSTAT